MKKVLFVLFAMLLAGVAFADEMQQTPPPEIFYVINDYDVTISAVGEGEVLMYDEGDNLVDNPFVVARMMYFAGDGYVTVKATAQAEGCLVSEPTYLTVVIPALPLPEIPVPTFEQVEDENGIWVYAKGEDPELDDVSLYLADVGGEAIANPYYLEKQAEEYYAFFQAMTIRNGLYESDWGFYTVLVPALPPIPDLPVPTFSYTEDDFNFTITAECAEPGAEVSLYIVDAYSGELTPVDNPYVLAKAYIEQRFTLKAVAHLDGYNDSESEQHFVVSAFYQKAPAPAITSTTDNEGITITIASMYDIATYWRYGTDASGDFEWSEWMAYDGPIRFTEPGNYSIEAYSQDEIWAASDVSRLDFTVRVPTPYPHYDFEVDGIYYNFTGNNTVAVTAHGDYLIGYHGDIVIPSTVNYNGWNLMVTAIEDNAFYGSYNGVGITSVKIGDYVTSIGKGAFKYCGDLTEVTLGDYVISIGDEAFYCCSGLTSVTIGSGVRTIGSGAFAGCTALADVICKPAVPPVMADSNCFDCYGTATLHVFPAVLDSYRTTNYWNRFSNIAGEDTVVPVTGDANGDGEFNISDVIQWINNVLNNN